MLGRDTRRLAIGRARAGELWLCQDRRVLRGSEKMKAGACLVGPTFGDEIMGIYDHVMTHVKFLELLSLLIVE